MILTWLLWNRSSACFCSSVRMMIFLPLISIPSMSFRSTLKVHYGFSSCGISFPLSGQSHIRWSFSCCKWILWTVVCCISCSDMHSGTYIAVLNMSMLIFIPSILLSLSLLVLCLDNQSTMKSSELDLYSVLTQYWCILRSIHWSLCGSVHMPFLNISTRSLWSVIILTSLAK